ncbi:tyrosine-type recombinase/integrase [Luteimonas sp. Sa2BVA3]|uniref:Tyrosine-type recombinase/integrase n=1 Tax=Luteimonas colneyensis TaxID=2762230 RepID=A0ABR8UIY6_9GAMM|nr:tyrosine-type recombinase/integrase [Luteimonas colneyensis]MBD7987619.1 tyrosine-type recombinase/integrase [Luteimonas colneyensis]
MTALTLVKTSPLPTSALSDAVAFELYFDQHLKIRRVTSDVIKNYRTLVTRMLAFVGKPVWEITPRDYERWMLSVLDKRMIKISTQRTYQQAVKGFYAYLVGDPEFQALVVHACGHRLENPVNARTAVVHRIEDESEGDATEALTREEFGRLQHVIDLKIAAHSNCLVALRAHQRNKVMTALQYYAALRIHELVALNRGDFQSVVATRAALGRYGAVKVRGKASRCSPKPVAIAPVVSPAFRQIADWYFSVVRPSFPEKGEDARKAVFLNRMGTRLSKWMYMQDYRAYLKEAGLWVKGRGSHANRRSTLTHASERIDLEFAQMLGRHRHLATTQIYVKLPKGAQAARLRAMVNGPVARSRTKKPHGKNRRST